MEPHAQGLMQFYASQAELLLAQYENINQLLGRTTDWTTPGTHCEILLRDFFRRNLLKGMSVDKGYVYGRVKRDEGDYHGPEIDILIHDTNDYRPVFRLEDFVIVQPEAVLGMIQVKRTFWPGKPDDYGTLAKGVLQAVRAKQHLLDVIVQQKIRKEDAICGGHSNGVKRYAEWQDMKPVFSAVVSFEDKTSKTPETYHKILLDAYTESRRYTHSECAYDTAVYVLPEFVGSLKQVSLCSVANVHERSYWVLECIHKGANVALQLLLFNLTKTIFEWRNESPPFSFPDTLKPRDTVYVPDRSKNQHDMAKKA
jgi:hypothetical protein